MQSLGFLRNAFAGLKLARILSSRSASALEERQELFRKFHALPMMAFATVREIFACLAVAVANSFGFCGPPVCERRRRVSRSLSPDVVFLIHA